jgi:hypothetical protein
MNIKYLISFVAGGLIGATIMKIIDINTINKRSAEVNALLEQLQHKVEAVEMNTEAKADEPQKLPENETVKNPAVKTQYQAVIRDYASISKGVTPVVSDIKPDPNPPVSNFGPWVIDPEEAGEAAYEDADGVIKKYDIVYLDHYANDALVDASGHMMGINEIIRTVGSDYAEHFGERGDDARTLYIRNDELKCDFEIYDNGEETYEEPSR